MDDDYDFIMLGTGLKETILSGIFSFEKNKILTVDENEYYGSDTASLNISQIFKKFGKETDEDPNKIYGHNRDWNIDIIPKLIMADGELVKTLVTTGVDSYIEFQEISGSYVTKNGKVHKVPSTPSEALKTKLMGMWEKRRFKKFLEYIDGYFSGDSSALKKGYDLEKMTGSELFDEFKLSDYTKVFIGHAMCLYKDESYMKDSALDVAKKLNLYINSIQKHGHTAYVYPSYGLGDLPQAFSRLSAIYGGLYMLNRKVDKVLYDESGHVTGIEIKGEVARTRRIVANSHYFPDKVKKVGEVARCVCILEHTVPNTDDSDSFQLIIPGVDVNRKNDIYVCGIGNGAVCPKGYFLASVSTEVETDDPWQELQPGLKLLGEIKETFFSVDPINEPINDPSKDGIYIVGSYDATSHFETTMNDVYAMYKKITGKDIDLESVKRERKKDQERN